MTAALKKMCMGIVLMISSLGGVVVDAQFPTAAPTNDLMAPNMAPIGAPGEIPVSMPSLDTIPTSSPSESPTDPGNTAPVPAAPVPPAPVPPAPVPPAPVPPAPVPPAPVQAPVQPPAPVQAPVVLPTPLPTPLPVALPTPLPTPGPIAEIVGPGNDGTCISSSFKGDYKSRKHYVAFKDGDKLCSGDTIEFGNKNNPYYARQHPSGELVINKGTVNGKSIRIWSNGRRVLGDFGKSYSRLQGDGDLHTRKSLTGETIWKTNVSSKKNRSYFLGVTKDGKYIEIWRGTPSNPKYMLVTYRAT